MKKDSQENRMIKVSAPGKLLLFGDHAVVYGYPALVAAIDKFLKVTLSKARSKDEFILKDSHDDRFVKKSLEVFRMNFGVTDNIKVETASELGNFGLGSSAAAVVATIKALGGYFKISLDEKKLFDLSFSVVQQVQKVGSGFDVAASVYGGLVYYQNKGEIIKKLPRGIDLPIVVGFSAVKADTVSMVKQVSRMRKKYQKKIDEILFNIGKLTRQAKEAIFDKDWIKLGYLMDQHQNLLENLGVSTAKLRLMIQAAKSAGALGAKLSGAGGGDCMIALVSTERKVQVEEAIRNASGKILDVDIYFF